MLPALSKIEKLQRPIVGQWYDWSFGCRSLGAQAFTAQIETAFVHVRIPVNAKQLKITNFSINTVVVITATGALSTSAITNKINGLNGAKIMILNGIADSSSFGVSSNQNETSFINNQENEVLFDWNVDPLLPGFRIEQDIFASNPFGTLSYWCEWSMKGKYLM